MVIIRPLLFLWSSSPFPGLRRSAILTNDRVGGELLQTPDHLVYKEHGLQSFSLFPPYLTSCKDLIIVLASYYHRSNAHYLVINSAVRGLSLAYLFVYGSRRITGATILKRAHR